MSREPVGPAPADGRRPNIVMIVVDDMRFDEYGGGHAYLETPHIDGLATVPRFALDG